MTITVLVIPNQKELVVVLLGEIKVRNSLLQDQTFVILLEQRVFKLCVHLFEHEKCCSQQLVGQNMHQFRKKGMQYRIIIIRRFPGSKPYQLDKNYHNNDSFYLIIIVIS